MVSSSHTRKSILLVWLTMLGWQVEVEHDGDMLVGVARHCTADGSTIRIGDCAPTVDELALRLFEAAMRIVEARRNRPRRSPVAA
jgi:hypothetical protein